MRTTIALALLALTACGEPAKPVVPGQFNPTGEVLATVNGMKVTQGMVDIVTSNMPPKQVEQMKAGPQWDQKIGWPSAANARAAAAPKPELAPRMTTQGFDISGRGRRRRRARLRACHPPGVLRHRQVRGLRRRQVQQWLLRRARSSSCP